MDDTEIEDQRHRRTQRSRSMPVTFDQCPRCSVVLSARQVAELKRGEPGMVCPPRGAR